MGRGYEARGTSRWQAATREIGRDRARSHHAVGGDAAERELSEHPQPPHRHPRRAQQRALVVAAAAAAALRAAAAAVRRHRVGGAAAAAVGRLGGRRRLPAAQLDGAIRRHEPRAH